jgi:hypothetical protein
VRALDCVHEAHDDVHFTAESDEALIEQIRQHRDEHHPEMTDDDVRELVGQSAYDE